MISGTMGEEGQEKRRNWTDLGILVQKDPARAAKKIASLLKRTRGNASEASRRLGIAHASLLRYFRRLRAAGHPVRPEGKVGRAAHEDGPAFQARAKAVQSALAADPAALTECQADVLRRRYPAEGEPQTCAAIAADLGVTRQAVQRAEKRALAKLGVAQT